ncbi:MAG: hypothetical protein ABMA15_12425 [Vicinamibacterales bacterium]
MRLSLFLNNAAPAEPTRVTHAVFIALLVLVVVPSRLITPFNDPPPGMVWPGLTALGVVAVWLVLWCLCTVWQDAIVVAFAAAAVFLGSFRDPLVGGALALALVLLHLGLRTRTRKRQTREASSPEAAVEVRDHRPDTTPATSGVELSGEAGHINVVDLDPIVTPYVRLLVAVRTIRASVAATLFVTLTTIPDALFDPVREGYEVIGGIYLAIVAGIPVTILAVLVSWFFFRSLRALWAGSVPALWSWFVLSIVVMPWGAVGLYLDTSRQDLRDGRVWFRAADFALHNVFFIALAIGTAFIVRRRQHANLLALLQQNRRRDWRTALRQLCGVVWPRGRWRTIVRDRSARWSIVAFLLEGIAFSPIGSANTSSTSALTLLPALPTSLSPLEGHYIALVVVMFLFLPGLVVWTQSMFRLADTARRRASRAALTPASDARRIDERPPVLFLRSFENDQVSLRSAAVAPSVRLVDPAFEQSHLEDVLQTCLSLGPVIAIGRPDDAAPPVGVPRLYVPTVEWRNVVTRLMDEASLVVVGVSESAGVIWEVEQLTKRQHLGKAVFVVPPEHARNRRLLDDLLRRVPPHVPVPAWEREVIGAHQTVGRRRVVSVTCRADRATIYVTTLRLSQVHYEAALRLGIERA